jgi:hypothetical protein
VFAERDARGFAAAGALTATGRWPYLQGSFDDNAQIPDRAFLVEGRVGFGKHLSNVFDFGLTVPVPSGYLLERQRRGRQRGLDPYQSIQGEALLYLRANIRIL